MKETTRDCWHDDCELVCGVYKDGDYPLTFLKCRSCNSFWHEDYVMEIFVRYQRGDIGYAKETQKST